MADIDIGYTFRPPTGTLDAQIEDVLETYTRILDASLDMVRPVHTTITYQDFSDSDLEPGASTSDEAVEYRTVSVEATPYVDSAAVRTRLEAEDCPLEQMNVRKLSVEETRVRSFRQEDEIRYVHRLEENYHEGTVYETDTGEPNVFTWFLRREAQPALDHDRGENIESEAQTDPIGYTLYLDPNSMFWRVEPYRSLLEQVLNDLKRVLDPVWMLVSWPEIREMVEADDGVIYVPG